MDSWNDTIGQTIDLLQRHQQHKLEIEFKMKNYTNLVLLYGTLIDKHLDYIEKSLINLFIADNDKGKDLKNKRTIENLYEQIDITKKDISYFETLSFQIENAGKTDLLEIKESDVPTKPK